jgi:hypothetical protein
MRCLLDASRPLIWPTDKFRKTIEVDWVISGGAVNRDPVVRDHLVEPAFKIAVACVEKIITLKYAASAVSGDA